MNSTHPSRAYNPLTRHLPAFETPREICDALRFNPMRDVDVSSLTLLDQFDHLIAERVNLNPSPSNLECAMTIRSMHRNSLVSRNPCLATGRLFVDERVAAGRSGIELTHFPVAPGACMLVIQGITGTAKTVTIKHACRLLGPQVIRHGEEPAALWKSTTQLSWLFVAMSHDGSRGGLLNSILIQVDSMLGTSYGDEFRRKYKTIEKLSGAVIALLHSLYVGLLVIDEIQLLNLVHSEQALHMHLFLLNLANSGIPLVLSGNPLGFSWLKEYSQNMSRAIERPRFYFHPCGALDDEDDWEEVFVGIRFTYVLKQPPIHEDRCSEVLKRRSGGIQKMAGALWCNAQRNVLLDPDRTMSGLTPEDIDDAYWDEAFHSARSLCDAFSNRDPILLESWRNKDIPVDYYAEKWGKSYAKGGSLGSDEGALPTIRPSPAENAKSSRSRPRVKESTKFEASETRKRRRKAKQEDAAKTLEKSDMRMEGLKAHNLASLDELEKRIGGLSSSGEPTGNS